MFPESGDIGGQPNRIGWAHRFRAQRTWSDTFSSPRPSAGRPWAEARIWVSIRIMSASLSFSDITPPQIRVRLGGATKTFSAMSALHS